MKHVKVMCIPGRVVDVELSDNGNIAEAVALAGMNLEGFTVTCTSPAEGASASTVVDNGATICLTRQVKGA